MNLKILFLIILPLLLLSPSVWAASCCGGSSALPALITGDDETQVSTSYTLQSNQAFVDGSGDWHRLSLGDSSQVLKLDLARLLSDRIQMGGSISLTQRSLGTMTSPYSANDTTFDLAYEILPEWDYSQFIPKGFVFLQVTAPTGKSIYESSNPFAIDVTGRGFWSVGLGSSWIKTWRSWDSTLSFDIHHSFDREFSNSLGVQKYRPGNGYGLSLGGGYSFSNYRAGASLAISYEDPVNGVANPVTGGIDSTGVPQQYWTGSLTLSYLISQELSAGLSYSDQTLFGVPRNTYLAQSFGINLQKRWPR